MISCFAVFDYFVEISVYTICYLSNLSAYGGLVHEETQKCAAL